MERFFGMMLASMVSQESGGVQRLLKGDFPQIRFATRKDIAEIVKGVARNDEPVDYYAPFKIKSLMGRAGDVDLYLAEDAPWPDELVELGLNKDERRAVEYAEEVKNIAMEGGAMLAICQKVHFESLLADDIGTANIEAFLSAQKPRVYLDALNHIFKAPETKPGFGKLGLKVEQLLRTFYQVGEEVGGDGKSLTATVGGVTKRLPNLWGMAPNRGLMKIYEELVFYPELQKHFPLNEPPIGATSAKRVGLERQRRRDDEFAMDTALLLWRFANADTVYAVGHSGKLVTSRLWGGGDKGKEHIPARQRSEWFELDDHTGQYMHREHVRAVGPPILFGAIPSIAFDFFETTVFDVVVPETSPEKIAMGYTERKQTVTLADILKGNGKIKLVETQGGEVVWDARTGLKIKEVEIPIQSLAQVDFGGAEFVNIAAEDKDHPKKTEYFDFALGPDIYAKEVPYNLAWMYFTKSFFDVITRNDFPKLFQELTETDMLFKMNKAWGVFFGMLGTAKGIPNETIKKLENYVRVVFVASVCTQLVGRSDQGIARKAIGGTLIDKSGQPVGRDKVEELMLAACSRTSFLTLKVGQETIGERAIDEAQLALFNRIVRSNEPAPLPGDLTNLFLPGDLELLKCLYPFGIRRQDLNLVL